MPTSTSQKRASLNSISTTSSTVSRPSITLHRHPSSASSSSSTSSSSSPPLPHHSRHKVQLIPHAPTPTHHATPLTPTEAALVRESEYKISEFDDLDLSSADFDFDDVFTFDGPTGGQRRLRGVVEVSVGGSSRGSQQTQPHRRTAQAQVSRRDWGDFSFSHFGAAIGRHQQQQQARLKPGMAGMQRELGIQMQLQGESIGAKYVRNQREAILGFQRRR